MNTELDLLKAFDSYNDFSREAFFTLKYNTIASNVNTYLPLKEGKENTELALALLDIEKHNLKPVYKEWDTKDNSDATPEDDFPYRYFFASESLPLAIYLSLSGEELSLEFYYDIHTPDLEEWVLALNHLFRSKFAEPKSPTFHILSRNSKKDNFHTRKVKTKNFQIQEIASCYNDDFIPLEKSISDSIEQASSGLILLHGSPGTGKTSYIKHLISKFPKHRFIFVQNEFVHELLKPNFITFLIQNRNSILIIEDAERIIMPRESSGGDSVVSTILQLTDGLFSDYLNIKVICTFNSSLKKVDKALLRKGRLIANYEFKPLAKEKANKLLKNLNANEVDSDMTLADIFNQGETGFEEDFEDKKVGF